MEENILKIVEEKEELEKEEKKIMEENMNNYNKLMNDYENNKIKYELYLKELEEEEKKIKNVSSEQGSDFYSEMNLLLEDLCDYVNFINKEFNMNEINNTRESFNTTLSRVGTETQFFYGRKIQNCINDIKVKEFMIEELINEINVEVKQDPQLTKIIMANVRLENRIEKIQNEKKKKQIEENYKRQNIIKKIGQSVIREKYKFREPIPYHILKERRKHIIKYAPDSTESNLLFY